MRLSEQLDDDERGELAVRERVTRMLRKMNLGRLVSTIDDSITLAQSSTVGDVAGHLEDAKLGVRILLENIVAGRIGHLAEQEEEDE